jgi:hypothetical protein
MYMLDNMIEMGLKEGESWASDMHREVAMNVCLCNPNITSRDALTYNVGIINKIPKKDINKVTFADLLKLGCRLI